MIETAILLPLYMIILYGVIYFGYATLSKQAQTSSAQYAAWLPQTQQAKPMLERFWPWAGEAITLYSTGWASEAESADTRLLIREERPQGDPYYGTDIKSQLVAGKGSLSGGRSHDLFDIERLTVDLWNYALGEVNQRFVWTEDGIEERIEISYDDMARFLSTSAQRSLPPHQRIGFIDTPVVVDAEAAERPAVGRYQALVTDAIDGPGSQWLERRRVYVESTYRPPFFKNVYSEPGAPPTDYGTYISLQYKEPEYEPTASLRIDVTGRGSGRRDAVGESGASAGDVLSEAADFLGYSRLPPADGMDNDSIGALGTVKDGWEVKRGDD